ncbi:mannose-6-phosphate isomerase, class I [Segetibacter aerophilus]|uniref:mannose-6-phosphate isomerase n=1 Tax=Segetibacter aerophilus TaxID=670293 RepID=A0A512B6U8_9BACT|nr:mannose-6-phosphate isomerase, class I [Segetibacter aerophilus]GEO07685.1 mannose-6-phosphate isomerase [Segetibacter aerophilus]
MKHRIFKLQGKVQHYAWGGYDFIPDLLGFENSANQPCAEYWMGAHPSASGKLETEDGLQPWYQLIQQEPVDHLGEKVYEKFGELPYLLKVLDVREMLSIQVHPTKEEARKGFEREEAEGVPVNAAHRNYKDKNHKPEVMVALGEFWLLHGFKKEEALQQVLDTVPEFNFLSKVFADTGYYGLYKMVMEMPQEESDNLLMSLVEREITTPHTKDQPGYWVSKLYNGVLPSGNVDKGLFSIYFFNIVRVEEGGAVFQGAGVPHAYLEGQNVELMANSDNVLRGGLTPKHVDVPELLKHIVFEGIEPNILKGEVSTTGDIAYSLPVEDFGISAIKLENGREYVSKSRSAEIFLVMKGEARCDNISCKRGESFVVLPGEEYTIRGIEDVLLYKAFVPIDRS